MRNAVPPVDDGGGRATGGGRVRRCHRCRTDRIGSAGGSSEVSTALRAGELSRAQLRSSAWKRLFPDVYACPSLVLDHRLRAHAARLLLPSAVLSGRSAAVWW